MRFLRFIDVTEIGHITNYHGRSNKLKQVPPIHGGSRSREYGYKWSSGYDGRRPMDAHMEFVYRKLQVSLNSGNWEIC